MAWSMEQFLIEAKKIAREAGEYQKSKLGRIEQVEFKGTINPVTEVDRYCERLIVNHLIQCFPDHGVLGEEGAKLNPGAAYQWIVDPLDGTVNFAHGCPLFAVSIALEFNKEVIIGVVFEPNRGELFHAVRGAGSFLNGNPIRVSQVSDFNQALIVSGFAYDIRETADVAVAHFQNMLLHAQAVRRDGVASTDLCYVACGRYDGFWERGLKAWDVAAGVLILTEAGGQVSAYDGSPHSIYANEILATNKLIHRTFSGILMGKKGQKRG